MNTDAYIGLGSNLGDRLGNLSRALGAMSALEGVHVIAVSNAVESEPWGVSEQPAFANAVARIATTLRADQLLAALKDIEVGLGRRGGLRYGPRVIDLDILLFGDEEWDTPDLAIPHARLAERDFAVTPLLEVAPQATWPDGSPVTRDAAAEGRITGALGPVPGFAEITPPPGGWVTAGRPEGTGGEEGANSVFVAGAGLSFATQLMYDAAVLEQEGVPVAWDPMPPGEEYSPWALPRLYRLLVPAAFADRARRVLVEARSGQILPPDASDFGTPEGEE
jgi:2-amino-4-hydroxy-6-hydroxymethyldihydropteridine diphosphokinase